MFAKGIRPALTSLIVLVAACGQAPSPLDSTNSLPLSSQKEQETPVDFCPNLDFTHVTWPTAIPLKTQKSLELALNITSSFEGIAGWANLTNNFDDQGLSMGLLDQALGQGSLQPLWIRMRNQNPLVLSRLFSSSHLRSISDMLTAWENSGGFTPTAVEVMSPLDVNSDITFAGAAELDSVRWAVENLYVDNGVTFKPDWAKELTNLGNHPSYIQIQALASLRLHESAKKIFDQIGVPELRAYLFSFDIVAQNGGIYSQNWAEYRQFLSSRPRASNTEKLMTLLEIRLKNVIPRFIPDVRSRKAALILGSGFVHGAKRDFQKEYCFNSLQRFE